jgi:tetratricopeptide (TPR) repeat protein
LKQSHKRQGRYVEAEEAYKKILTIRPDMAYTELAILYKQQSRYSLAEEYFRKARKFRAEYYNPVTRYNYQKLKKILALRKIKLVSVSYPTRSSEPLKKMLGLQDGGIIFVDNEMIFKKALQQGGYSKYFIDACYGDFGHGTKEGNGLLAENIANVILREVFLINGHNALNGDQNLEKAEEDYLLNRTIVGWNI